MKSPVVLLADDEVGFVETLSKRLRKRDLSVVTAHSGQEALRLCREIQPDVILMDMMMPGMNGVDTTKAIKNQYPQIQIIALTSFQEGNLVKQAMQGVSIDALAEAIRAANAGNPALGIEATQALIQATTASAQQDYDLTQRQQEVLTLIVEGLSNVQIAKRMILSTSTVRHHVSEILSKLDASNRAEAAVLAVKHGLIPDKKPD